MNNFRNRLAHKLANAVLHHLADRDYLFKLYIVNELGLKEYKRLAGEKKCHTETD